MGRPAALRGAKAAKAAELIAAGWSISQVATTLDVSRDAVRRVIKRVEQARQVPGVGAAAVLADPPPLPDGERDSDIAVRIEIRDKLRRRFQDEDDSVELTRLSHALNETLDGLRRARAVPVAEEDFADEDAAWVIAKLRKHAGEASLPDSAPHPEGAKEEAIADDAAVAG